MTFENIQTGGVGRQGAGQQGAQDAAIAGEEAQMQGVFMKIQRTHTVECIITS
jgi:hypothetical protein